jgi:hypothetical protein
MNIIHYHNIMITTIIIHNECDDESHSQQNLMVIPITITFLIESSNQIQFWSETTTDYFFLKDRLTIELGNLSNLILNKTSHNGSIKFLR